MTMTAFALAVAGAVASTASSSAETGVFGYTYEGLCISEGGISVPSGCTNSSGSQICTAYFPGYDGVLEIYSVRIGGTCLTPYRKW